MQQRSKIISEDSPLLLVQGELVRLTLTNGKRLCHVCECSHLSLGFEAVFDLDQDALTGSAQHGDQSSTEDGLISIDWNDSSGKKKRRIFLLLKWVDDGRAE